MDTPAPQSTHRRSNWRHYLNLEMNQTSLAFVLILPSLILTLGLTLWPIIQTLILSVQNTNLSRPGKERYIGFENYIQHLSDDFFWETIRRTAYFTILSVALELIIGIAIAMLLAQRLRGWKFLRLVIIIPWAIPTIVNATLWRWILNANYGALNGLLLDLGIIDSYVAWLNDPMRAMNFVIVADVWHTTPLVVLIISAALASLPEEIFEAAAIDGANSVQRFIRITLPLLRPAILVVLVVRTVEAFRVFDIIYVITKAGPVNGTMTISYMTYEETFRYLRIGSGSALSFIVSIFILALALIYIRILYTEDTV